MTGSRRQPARLVGHAVLLTLAITALFPITLVVLNSLKTQPEIVRNPLSLPLSPQFSNFVDAWRYGHFGRGFLNSIILTTTTIVVVLFCASLAGYVLAGKRLRFWPAVMIYFMVAMTVPIQLFLFPLYFLVSRLHLLGNVVAVGVIMAGYLMPISVFLMRTFFLRIPKEIEEAAVIDGANKYQLLRHVLLPVVSPGLITVGVIVGLMTWNEFLISRTFLQGQQSLTAPLGYLTMRGTFTVNQGVMMAGALILIVPVVVIFLLVQRRFIDGFVTGSVRG